MQEYYSTGEFAELIGVSSQTLYVWDKNGKLKPDHRETNGYRYYSKKQLYEFFTKEEKEIFNKPTKHDYLVKCWECGVLSPSYLGTACTRVMCNECRQIYEDRKQDNLQKYIILKMKVMYERALRMMEKSEKVNMCEIEEAAKVVEEHSLKNLNAFASSQEMIATIVLLHSEVRVKVQYPVKGRKIDIFLPELNIGVEVDGALHKGKEIKDSRRDIFIRNELGTEFEMVRIPTKYIEQNPMKTLDYIRESYKQKKIFRSKNNGILPDYYSKREKEVYKKILND